MNTCVQVSSGEKGACVCIFVCWGWVMWRLQLGKITHRACFNFQCHMKGICCGCSGYWCKMTLANAFLWPQVTYTVKKTCKVCISRLFILNIASVIYHHICMEALVYIGLYCFKQAIFLYKYTWVCPTHFYIKYLHVYVSILQRLFGLSDWQNLTPQVSQNSLPDCRCWYAKTPCGPAELHHDSESPSCCRAVMDGCMSETWHMFKGLNQLDCM